jgi:TRAP-type C4-dicarboxylate transport system substrate-binding protein
MRTSDNIPRDPAADRNGSHPDPYRAVKKPSSGLLGQPARCGADATKPVARRAAPGYRRTVNRRGLRTARTLAPPLAISLMLVAAGCGSPGSNKIGATATPRKPLVLSMANFNSDPLELQTFADEVASLSHGALQISFINGYRQNQVDAEEQMIGDLRGGETELAAVPSRAWDAAGVVSFEALQAPFLIDSYTLEQQVLDSGIPGKMLQGVTPLGLVGLGVLPGPLRYLLSAPRPLRTPPDFAGLRIGYHGANEPAETLRALGAKPVQLQSGAPWVGLDAIEQQLASIYGNNYDTFAKYLTANAALWPRPWVVAMNNKAYASLAPAERAVLRKAASSAVPAMIAAVRAQDRTALADLCQRHLIRLVTATPHDLSELHAAVAPVLAHIERDQQTRSFITAIDTMRSAGTTAEAPPSCTPHAVSSPTGLPNGAYTTRITPADVQRSGLPPAGWAQSHFALVLKSGNFVLYQFHSNGLRETLLEGTYSLYRDHIVARGGFNGSVDKITARWSFNGTSLTFADVKSNDPLNQGSDSLIWESEPWTHR